MDTLVTTIRRARDSNRPGRPASRQSRLPRLADAMERSPTLLPEQSCVREALNALAHANLGAVLVTDDQGRPVGEFTRALALQLLASGAYHGRAQEGCRQLHGVMRREALVVSERADPFALAERLVQDGRELAAVVEAGKLVGTVSRANLLALLANLDDPHCSAQERADCRSRPLL